MKVVYIANDGTKFDNEDACMDYELLLDMPHLKDIQFFDYKERELKDPVSYDTHESVARIIVPSEEALCDLHKLRKEMDLFDYENITSCGEWLYDFNDFEFVKVE